jgi:hypothetical protein
VPLVLEEEAQMFGLQLSTFDREAAAKSKDALPFIGSYLWMRMAIGLLGVLLPVLLVLIDWWFLETRRPIRSSMSAYYHTSSGDLFVGGLFATGLFLVTYMAAKKRTYDYVLSTVGGVLVIVVALLPTARSGTELGVKDFKPSGDSCTTYPGPPVCNGFQNRWGEDVVRDVHQVSACTFVVLLAVLCVVFALREFGYGPAARALLGPGRSVRGVVAELKRRRVRLLSYLWRGLPPGVDPNRELMVPRRRVLSLLLAALLILTSALWALVGTAISLPGVDGEVGSTYVGEFGAFVTFGTAWLVASWDLMPRPVQAAGGTLARAVNTLSGVPTAAPDP